MDLCCSVSRQTLKPLRASQQKPPHALRANPHTKQKLHGAEDIFIFGKNALRDPPGSAVTDSGQGQRRIFCLPQQPSDVDRKAPDGGRKAPDGADNQASEDSDGLVGVTR